MSNVRLPIYCKHTPNFVDFDMLFSLALKIYIIRKIPDNAVNSFNNVLFIKNEQLFW